jgi:hypothetical protein
LLSLSREVVVGLREIVVGSREVLAWLTRCCAVAVERVVQLKGKSALQSAVKVALPDRVLGVHVLIG